MPLACGTAPTCCNVKMEEELPMTELERHPGDSSVQRNAEAIIRAALEKDLGTELVDPFPVKGPRPDGFADAEHPICVEIWAHQGLAKSAQKAKVMQDLCKLLHCERLLGKQCRKIFVVSDADALSFLRNSWRGLFAEEFGIELRIIDIPSEVCESIRQAQKGQCR